MGALDTLLSALARAAGGHGTEARFPWSDVVILAWREDPQRYGMRGFPQYPDTKRVAVSAATLIHRGLLHLARGSKSIHPKARGTGLWRLTQEGFERGVRLQQKGAA